MKKISVRDVVLGDGVPKIIVPLMGASVEDIRLMAKHYRTLPDFDIVEFRADHLNDALNVALQIEVVQVLREVFQDKPILYTFRTAAEGGEVAITAEQYWMLNQEVINTGLVDLVDFELFLDHELKLKHAINQAHLKAVKVIVSNHDFSATPQPTEIVQRLCKMQALGADVVKIAVMPQAPQDVLNLLQASLDMYTQHATCPMICLSMGKLGVMSRLAGSAFGSCASFGAIEQTSAPGQVNATILRQVVQLV